MSISSCISLEQEVYLAAQLGKSLLERNSELEELLAQRQNKLEDQAFQIAHLLKQLSNLRDVEDARLRYVDQLEGRCQELDVEVTSLTNKSKCDRKHIESLSKALDQAGIRCEQLERDGKLQFDRAKTPVRRQGLRRLASDSSACSLGDISSSVDLSNGECCRDKKLVVCDLKKRLNTVNDRCRGQTDLITQLHNQLNEIVEQGEERSRRLEELEQALDASHAHEMELKRQLNEQMVKPVLRSPCLSPALVADCGDEEVSFGVHSNYLVLPPEGDVGTMSNDLMTSEVDNYVIGRYSDYIVVERKPDGHLSSTPLKTPRCSCRLREGRHGGEVLDGNAKVRKMSKKRLLSPRNEVPLSGEISELNAAATTTTTSTIPEYKLIIQQMYELLSEQK